MEKRRTFVKKVALASGALSLGFSAKSYERIQGANDRIRVAFQGLGRRVGAYYPVLEDQAVNVELAYLCDVKQSQVTRAMDGLKNRISYTPKTTEDFNTVLDDNNVDAVFIATPDHWHVAASVMAMKAGKQVYVEKPCSHNPKEGELIIAAMKKYDAVVQMGNQQRSDHRSIDLIRQIHEGAIGQPYKAVAFYTNSRSEVPQPTAAAPPNDLNWELFQGPAPREEYRHNTWDYNWHWYGWKWGTAESGNNAIHELDIARWALQVGHPERVVTDGAKLHYANDGWEMYDTMHATFHYEDNKTIEWDGKSRNGYSTYGAGRGTIIYGTEGSAFVDRTTWRLYNRAGQLVKESSERGTEQGTALGGGGDMSTAHVVNFLEAIRGKQKLRSPIEEGVISTHLCHLINISYRVQKPLTIDPTSGKIKDEEAMKYWKREYEPGWEIEV